MSLGVAAVLFIALNCQPSDENVPIVDKDIRYKAYEEASYPEFARQTRTEGVVVVRLKLDGRGGVSQATALAGHENLIQAALENAKKWQFEPNSRNAAVLIYNFRMASGLCNSTFFNFQPPDLLQL